MKSYERKWHFVTQQAANNPNNFYKFQDVYAVYREPHKQEDAELCLAYRKTLLDGFVNCICFYLWYGMI